MSYRVLARVYRSNTFDEVVGQETIATTLKNAITSGRVHHGYLFTGTRGVGKTSMARILAKALNCLACDAPTTTPCCQCELCKAVAVGEDVDVVEIDAASNTGVDNIRDLRSNATLRPARARFKVYIIDEVHMLSTQAFNALLKTLEEPPSHVKFILATTDVHKVPATIQSRCQRFDFRAIEPSMIAAHLRQVAAKEGVEADEAVLRRTARLAGGSIRDALSLLDMLLSYAGDRLTTEVSEELLPPAHDELAAALLDRVAEKDAAGALRAFDSGLQSGRTIDRFCDQIVEHLRTLMVIRICGKDTELVDVPMGIRDELSAQAGRFDPPTFVYMITLMEELRRLVKSTGAGRAVADAAVVRLAMSQQFSDVSELLAQLERGGSEATAIDRAESAPKVPSAQEVEPARQPEPARGTVSAPARTLWEPSGRTGPTASAPPAMEARASSEVESAPPKAPAAKITSAQWEQVLRHPRVQHVRELVDGSLLNVRPDVRPPQPDALASRMTGGSAGGAAADAE